MPNQAQQQAVPPWVIDWEGRGGRGGRREEMREDRFGCDQALPGCDSTRLSQQLRLVTAADVPLCSTTREYAHIHTLTLTLTSMHTHSHTLFIVLHTQKNHAHTDALSLLCSVLFTHCDHSVAGNTRAKPTAGCSHPGCQDYLPEVLHITS